MIKECMKPNCGKKYRVCDEGFGLNNCRVCGAPLKIIEEKQVESKKEINETMIIDETFISTDLDIGKEYKENKELEIERIGVSDETTILEINEDECENLDYTMIQSERVVEEEEFSDIFDIDNFGYIHFDSMNEKNIETEKIIIYLDKIIYSVVPLKYDEMIIGRAVKNLIPDINLANLDIEKVVSRRHGVIYKRNGYYYIKNIASQNSLQINGEELVKNRDRRLDNGDVITVSRKFKLKYVE